MSPVAEGLVGQQDKAGGWGGQQDKGEGRHLQIPPHAKRVAETATDNR